MSQIQAQLNQMQQTLAQLAGMEQRMMVRNKNSRVSLGSHIISPILVNGVNAPPNWEFCTKLCQINYVLQNTVSFKFEFHLKQTSLYLFIEKMIDEIHIYKSFLTNSCVLRSSCPNFSFLCRMKYSSEKKMNVLTKFV